MSAGMFPAARVTYWTSSNRPIRTQSSFPDKVSIPWASKTDLHTDLFTLEACPLGIYPKHTAQMLENVIRIYDTRCDCIAVCNGLFVFENDLR